MVARARIRLGISVFLVAVLAFIGGVATGSGHKTVTAPHVISLADASTEFFVSGQTAGLNCELDTSNAPASSYPTKDYCQSVTPAQSVSLGTSGPAKTCHGVGCIGNPGLGTPTFPAGDDVTLGRTTCRLESNAVHCTMGAHGFLLSLNPKRTKAW